MIMIMSKEIKCNKCSYEWKPRKNPMDIKECPKCKSRDWNNDKHKQRKNS